MKWLVMSVAAVVVASLLAAAAQAASPKAPPKVPVPAPPPGRGGARVSPKALPPEFDVYAADDWTSTGIQVGPTVSVDVVWQRGYWTTIPTQGPTTGIGYPELPAPLGYSLRGAASGSLLGRVNGTIFFLGNNGHVPDGLSGVLELIANDDYYAALGAGRADNAGSIHVKVYVSAR
jgi:hypothetical protein